MAKWYQLSAEETIRALESESAYGLSAEETAKRQKKYGYNELQEKAKETLWQKLFKQFKDALVVILIFASLVSMVLGEVADSLVILVIVILNAVLGVFQESKAEKALDALKKMTTPTSKVIREGNTVVVPSRELVPGDIVLLEAGDYVPADMRLLETINLKMEEASLTGESVPVEKSPQVLTGDVSLADRHNMGFMGTTVTYGKGKGIVTGTAMLTEIGKIAEMLQSVKEDATPLQKKLEEFGKKLGLACLLICAAVFVMGIYNVYRAGTLHFADVELMLMTSISLAVAAVPEGLPAIVTVVLALGMQRMVKRNAIVKKLHAVETLGSISVICSDKTGTLTQNQMTVVKIFAAGDVFDIGGDGYKPLGSFTLRGKEITPADIPELDLLLKGSLLCNDALLKKDEDSKAWTIVGDPTEGALVVAAAKAGYTQSTSSQFPRIGEIPFDSNRKMMTTFHDMKGEAWGFVKGAPDILLSRCTRIAINGLEKFMTEEDIRIIQKANTAMAAKALRVLAVAYRKFDVIPDELAAEKMERELVFVGLLGMIDPPRSEAKRAVQVCEGAGIRPIMITGDHPDTAFAIAKDLGIARNSDEVITGRELDAMQTETIREVVQKANVFARVSPEHKMAIIEALRNNKQIVAMTGDGVNDAPALKKADIGVAMGITGTDVTKETAEMIVSDDNFASIVSAVEEGRVIYTNIRKFIYFLLSCNAAEVLIVFISMLLGWPIPLLPIQLLWTNLVTDAFPALALGVEQKEPNVMAMKPRDPDAPLLSKRMLTMIGIQSLAVTAAVLGAFQYGLHVHQGDIDAGRTFAFIVLIVTQIVYSYSARSANYSVFQLGVFSNRYLNWGVGLSFLLLLISVHGPLHSIFKTVEPVLSDWGIMIALSFIPFFVSELAKLIFQVFTKMHTANSIKA